MAKKGNINRLDTVTLYKDKLSPTKDVISDEKNTTVATITYDNNGQKIDDMFKTIVQKQQEQEEKIKTIKDNNNLSNNKKVIYYLVVGIVVIGITLLIFKSIKK